MIRKEIGEEALFPSNSGDDRVPVPKLKVVEDPYKYEKSMLCIDDGYGGESITISIETLKDMIQWAEQKTPN